MDITLKMNNHVTLEASEDPYLKPQTCSSFVSAFAETGLAIHLSSEFLVDDVATGRLVPNAALIEGSKPLVAELTRQRGASTEEPSLAPAAPASEGAWHVSVRFSPNALRDGLDPIAFVRHLGTIAEVRGVALVEGPQTDDPTDCRLGFELSLRAEVDEGRIEEAFGLAKDHCRVWILPPGSPPEAFLRLIDLLPEGPTTLDPMIRRLREHRGRRPPAGAASRRGRRRAECLSL